LIDILLAFKTYFSKENVIKVPVVSVSIVIKFAKVVGFLWIRIHNTVAISYKLQVGVANAVDPAPKGLQTSRTENSPVVLRAGSSSTLGGSTCPEGGSSCTQREAPATLREAPATLRKAPAALRKAPASLRKAPAPLREAPAAQRQAPAAQRQAPTAQRALAAQRQAPTALREAPAELREAPAALSRANEFFVLFSPWGWMEYYNYFFMIRKSGFNKKEKKFLWVTVF
jgi:hypothetical protein